MKIREYEGFQIEIYPSGDGYVVEVFRKGKLLRTIWDESGTEELPFQRVTLAFDAAKDWIDRTYSRKIKYKGYILASPPFTNPSGSRNSA